MIEKKRIEKLNDAAAWEGEYVFYWMQAAQRVRYNHALEFAIEQANELNKPVLVGFGLMDDYPEANERHYAFMLEGLNETQKELAKRKIKMVVLRGRPDEVALGLGRKACLIVMDDGYLKHQTEWRERVACEAECAVYEVVTNLIVPVEQASEKENFSAGTLRPRITKRLAEFMKPLRNRKVIKSSLKMNIKAFDVSDVGKALGKLKIDRSVTRSRFYEGGTSAALKRLKRFIGNTLAKYDTLRNDPCEDGVSNMSPYLHFGQISPLEIALKVQRKGGKGADAYLEELIVRRELSHNFVYYNRKYDCYEGLEPWAKRTLDFHAKDQREYVYTSKQFENAQTHDEYWNAAQKEMVLTGKMHGYMRMYWGKKILEWSKNPKEGIRIALYLNNKYELDGRDPNGYAGVLWCFGKHDRAWGEREVFGKVRYMNANGLKRKFDADAYVRKIAELEKDLKQ